MVGSAVLRWPGIRVERQATLLSPVTDARTAYHARADWYFGDDLLYGLLG
jgi:hypothetical protein